MTIGDNQAGYGFEFLKKSKRACFERVDSSQRARGGSDASELAQKSLQSGYVQGMYRECPENVQGTFRLWVRSSLQLATVANGIVRIVDNFATSVDQALYMYSSSVLQAYIMRSKAL
jgi:hypothetical protein